MASLRQLCSLGEGASELETLLVSLPLFSSNLEFHNSDSHQLHPLPRELLDSLQWRMSGTSLPLNMP